jgi:hypothetical protein
VGKILLVVILFAALVYGVLWLIEKARAGQVTRRRPSATRPAQRRTLAPDDDEEFLRDLNRRRRKGEGSPPNE